MNGLLLHDTMLSLFHDTSSCAAVWRGNQQDAHLDIREDTSHQKWWDWRLGGNIRETRTVDGAPLGWLKHDVSADETIIHPKEARVETTHKCQRENVSSIVGNPNFWHWNLPRRQTGFHRNNTPLIHQAVSKQICVCFSFLLLSRDEIPKTFWITLISSEPCFSKCLC